jgi:branched-chain amino acid transport system permease protein
MTTFIQMVINGLALGSVYALMALGFTIIFRAAGTMNFAQGSVMMLGGLLVVRLHDALGFWGALVVAAAITAVWRRCCCGRPSGATSPRWPS